jgi:hypothetical protein
MTPQERQWLETLLEVRAPWQVQGFKWSDGTRQLSVQVGTAAESAGPFWAPRKPSAGGQRLHWAHLPMAGRRCEVVLTLREGQPLPEAPWAGEPELPFSQALSRLVLDLMLDGATMSQLCRMLDLPLSDLWKYKFRLDHGSARPPQARDARETREAARPAAAPAQPAAQRPPLPVPVPPPVATRPIELAPAAPRVADDDEAIPPEDAPVWLALLTGRQTIEVRALGLKLLLSKLTREAATHRDADLHRQASRGLYRYFVRNQPLLAGEIAQLRTADAAARAALQASLSRAMAGEDEEVPDVSDPLWQALLSGDCDIEVRTLSLRLLLTKLRQQARGLQDDELRMLKLVELHRFFARHRAVLRHELEQLRRWTLN